MLSTSPSGASGASGASGTASPARQIEAAKSGALAVPEGELAILVVTGNDRVAWLNGLLTCDLVKRAAGAAVYGLAVARNGRVLADLVVVFDEGGSPERQRLLVAVPRAVSEALRTHLDHYLVMEDAEMSAGAFEAWSLHGPQSLVALEAARTAGAVGGVLDRTGLGGAFLLAPIDRAHDVRAALAAAATLGDATGWDALRLERAVPRFGVDFDDKTYPQEAGLEKTAISFDKGCYLGQEVVCMLELRGHVKRKLAALVLDTQEPPSRGAPVTDGGGVSVGEVTSASGSPTLGGKAVALAMIKRAQAEPGQGVVVGGARGEVVARPV
jgi:folate-binding protein YgfZ